jgi:hypothetical protein
LLVTVPAASSKSSSENCSPTLFGVRFLPSSDKQKHPESVSIKNFQIKNFMREIAMFHFAALQHICSERKALSICDIGSRKASLQ